VQPDEALNALRQGRVVGVAQGWHRRERGVAVARQVDLGHEHDAELASALDPRPDLVDRVAPARRRRW
jgi:hypothetical protein